MYKNSIRLFVSFIFLIAVSAAGAQSVRIGGWFGGNFSSETGDDFDSFLDEFNAEPNLSASKTQPFGYSVGSVIDFELSPGFAIQTAASFTERTVGYVLRDREFNESLEVEATVSSADVMMFAKPQFPMNPGLSFHVLAGPQVSFLIADLETTLTFTNVDGTESETVIEPADNDVLFGISGGAGIGYETTLGILTFDLLYYRSLNAVFDDEPAFEQPVIQSFGFSVSFTSTL